MKQPRGALISTPPMSAFGGKNGHCLDLPQCPLMTKADIRMLIDREVATRVLDTNWLPGPVLQPEPQK